VNKALLHELRNPIIRQFLLLAIIWCLLLHAQCLETGTDKLVVVFFKFSDKVMLPGVLKIVQVINGFCVAKQYGRHLVLWFSHPVTVEEDWLGVIAFIDRVMLAASQAELQGESRAKGGCFGYEIDKE
jgi:hypothetical protein